MDIIAIDSNGKCQETAHLTPEQHWAVFGGIVLNDFPLLTRLSDYYGDAQFGKDELEMLVIELGKLRSMAAHLNVSATVDSISHVLYYAISSGCLVEALAD